jgi:alcohol dehydrogenase (NADP+)
MPKNTSLELSRPMRLSYGLAALNQGDRLVPWSFERRDVRYRLVI